MHTASLVVDDAHGIAFVGPPAEVMRQLEPNIVIPMHYRTEVSKDELAPLDRFLKEMGAKNLEPQPKLTVGRSSLPHETQVVLLDYRR